MISREDCNEKASSCGESVEMTDRPGENRPAPFFGLGADLKALAGAIGWLAGAMSGVVALMYAVGFLCAKSHLYILHFAGSLRPFQHLF